MSKRFFFLPLILLLVIGCTVTKRVHNPGYHIEWKKNYRQSSKTDQKDLKTESNALLPEEENLQTTVLKSSDIDSVQTQVAEQEVIYEDNSIVHSPIKHAVHHQIDFEELSEESQHSLKHPVERTNSKMHSMRPIFWRLSGKTLKKIGVVLLVLGTLILLGAMFSATGLFSGSTASSDSVTFFIDTLLFIFAEWFWILIVVIVVILIIYFFVLIVELLFGGAFIGFMVGLGFIGAGLLIWFWGKRREDVWGGE